MIAAPRFSRTQWRAARYLTNDPEAKPSFFPDDFEIGF
jgi:hypothetical protein